MNATTSIIKANCFVVPGPSLNQVLSAHGVDCGKKGCAIIQNIRPVKVSDYEESTVFKLLLNRIQPVTQAK
jgi:hypothetical protein